VIVKVNAKYYDGEVLDFILEGNNAAKYKVRVYFDLWDEEMEVWEYQLNARNQGSNHNFFFFFFFLFSFAKFINF
jgi:hypothetical protein